MNVVRRGNILRKSAGRISGDLRGSTGLVGRATIVDVAEKAGVSVATVSRVVNGNYPVRECTRKKVQEAIGELRYVPNIQARELNTRHSSSVGVVVPSFYNMYFAEIVDGIEEMLHRNGFSMLLTCMQNNAALERECVRNLVSRNVSGIILASPDTENVDAEFYDLTSRQVPLVFVNSPLSISNASHVSNDEHAGMILALEHLYDIGHRKILLVCGDNGGAYLMKKMAYREFMDSKGLYTEENIINIGDGNSIDAAERTERLLEGRLGDPSSATAACCCNDVMACGVLNAARHAGLSVPEQFSVTGFDNTPLSRYVDPEITTVDQNMAKLGHVAVKLLLEKIETGKDRNVVLENHLVMRKSTGFLS